MNNKKITKRGPEGAQLLFLYEVSIVVLIDFIALLLTPGIFLIQIINTNNTNMYLIHFHVKNKIKMHFPKVEFLKFQNWYQHSLSIGTRSNKLRCHQYRRHNNGTEPDFPKKRWINNYYIYCSEFWLVFWWKFFKYFFKNKWKLKLKIGLCTVVVHTILSRVVFFFPSEIKIQGWYRFWVRPT